MSPPGVIAGQPSKANRSPFETIELHSYLPGFPSIASVPSSTPSRDTYRRVSRGSMKIAAVVLILAGVAALAYGGFTYTTHKKAVDLGPVQIETKSNHTVLIPPLLGVAGILIGGALLFVGGSRNH